MAKPLDTRQWVTTDDLNVSPEVLGLALAGPTRRLMAMLLDLAVIGMVSSFLNIWWLGALALVGVVHARGQQAAEAALPGALGGGLRKAGTAGSAGSAGSSNLAMAGSDAARQPTASSVLLQHPRHWPRRQWLLLGLAAMFFVAGAMQAWQDQTRPRPARHQRSVDDGEAADALAEAAERIADAADAAAEKATEKAAEKVAEKVTANAAGNVEDRRPIVRRAGGAISDAAPSAEASAASGPSAASAATVSPAASGQVSELPASDPASQASAAASAGAAPVISKVTALALAQQSDRILKLETQLAEARRARSLDPRVWLRRWADDLGLGYGMALVYFSLLPAWWGGQTVGKRLMRLRVVELTGKPMTALRNLKRFGGYAAGMATGGLGLVQLLWDSNRQAIQDKTAHTAVIDLRLPRLAPPPALSGPALTQPAPTEASRLAAASSPRKPR